MSTPTIATRAAGYICRYCRQPSDASATTCPLCGAPVDVREVTVSGWEKQPGIKDMARLQFGQSHVQISGTQVPIADFNLASGDSIYFGHHTVLWADPGTRLEAMPMSGGFSRMLAGMPIVMTSASGPGHIALSDDAAGEVIALPLSPGQQIWVREHRFLAASNAIAYSFQQTGVWITTGQGNDAKTHYPLGMFGDHFTSVQQPGLVLLHSPGNTFVRDLQPGQSILMQPTSLLYCDVTVQKMLHIEYPRGFVRSWFSTNYSLRSVWLRLIGPGRVAMQSQFVLEDENEMISRSSTASSQRW